MSEADQDKKLICMYITARDKATKQGGTIRSHFDLNSLSAWDQADASHIDLIKPKSFAISLVQDEKFRKVSHFQAHFCSDTVT